MRANLLPRAPRAFRAAGIVVDGATAREALTGAIAVAAVLAAGTWIGDTRIAQLAATAERFETTAARQAPERERVRKLLVDVAKLQAFERESARLRRSGSDAALELAKIGNAVDRNVWLDGIERTGPGYVVTGGARSVARLSATLANLGRALPGDDATLVGIDNRSSTSDGLHFTARVSAP